MLRLTLLLCAGLFAALMIAGEDRGQMRPGLALAAAEGRVPKVREPASMAPAAEPAPVLAQTPAPAPVADPLPEAVAKAEPQAAPYVEPARAVVQEVKEPIFTLSALGNELVPGEAGAVKDTAAFEAPQVATEADGTIWYVTARSVNVRAEPTTEAEVLGKLTNGEAALLVSTVDGDWARIVIQGDGMEGYVALRYLTPAAP
ncbi:SH3 domain-containing protein [Tabrizicola sp.]|uniref:SH3 domain-containing protein n=1 Tax=Tabrizicola sp. TaxID=2005166 RepID=UPI002638ED4A|nr:SH3 domain-containing protein [Tabrizicola sp.]MDM7931208.1 SH3 domain-containing protein [Tabrizicola sp.]